MKSQQQREKMLNGFADPEGSDSIELNIARSQDDGKSFSNEALDDFRDSLFLFVGGRICAFHTKEDKPARHLKVKIEVTVEN